MYISNFLGQNVPLIASGSYVAGEAVVPGQIAVIGADGLAYYAQDPLSSPYAMTNMRPISAVATQNFPLLQNSTVAAQGNFGFQRTTMCKLSNGSIAVLFANASNQLYVTLFTPTGAVAVPAFFVGNVYMVYGFPSITALTGGGFVVAWSLSGGTGANPPQFAIYSNAGAVVTATTAFDPLMVYCYGIEVCALSTGGFAVAYHGGTVAGGGITQPKYAVYTVTGAVTLASTVLAQNTSYTMPANVGGVAIFALPGAVGFVVGYLNMQSATNGGLYFQRISNVGVLQGAAGTISAGMAITSVSSLTEILYGVALTGGGFAFEYHVTNANVSIWSSTGVQQGATVTFTTGTAAQCSHMAATSDGGLAVMVGTNAPATTVVKYSATGVSVGSVILSAVTSGSTLQMAVLADNTLLCLWNDAGSTYGIAILNSAATAVVSQGAIASSTAITASYVTRLTPVQVPNASTPSAVTYAFLDVYNSNLALMVTTTAIQKYTPVGVYAAAAAQGATVSVQYTGVATLASGFLQPYTINAQSNSPPGQKMNVVGNSCQMVGIQ
jgi:hypothetical protein